MKYVLDIDEKERGDSVAVRDNFRYVGRTVVGSVQEKASKVDLRVRVGAGVARGRNIAAYKRSVPRHKSGPGICLLIYTLAVQTQKPDRVRVWMGGIRSQTKFEA